MCHIFEAEIVNKEKIIINYTYKIFKPRDSMQIVIFLTLASVYKIQVNLC